MNVSAVLINPTDNTKLPYLKKVLDLTFVNNHSVVYDFLTAAGGLALFRPTFTHMCKLVIAFVGHDLHTYMQEQGSTFDTLH